MQRLNWGQFWQRGNATRWSWIESIAITVIILLLCFISNPSNPFYINSIFPWPWFAAIIIALQYGFGPGVVSIVIISLAISIHTSIATLSTLPYQSYLLTGILLTFTCALYSSNWMQRILRAEELHEYTDQRLETLSRSYNVLRVSYDYLEQSLVSKPVTLREIEKKLQQSLLESHGEITAKNAEEFLQITSHYCSLRNAAVYLFKQNKLNTQPIAAIGALKMLDNNDPLIRYVMDNNELNYVTLNDMSDPRRTSYIVVVPMYTSKKELIGILTVTEMSFWRLNHETMQVMQILALYFAEEVSAVKQTKELLAIYPDNSPEFLKELSKLIYLKKAIGIDSAIITIRINKTTQSENIIYSIKKQQRGLDYLWHRIYDQADLLIILMPFTNAVGISGYFTRVNRYLHELHGKDFEALGIKERSILLYDQKPEMIIDTVLSEIMEIN